jgi:ABC-2 type transport system permease protein
MLAVFRKELTQYFVSPIGYALIATFWLISGYFFSFNVFIVNAVHMVTAFHNMSILLLLMLPLLTMRLFAEEARQGTLELLLTLPTGEAAIVIGKILAALIVLTLMIGGTAAAVLPLMLYGNPDLGPILGGYAGVLMLGAAFIAIGMFISSLSSNQIVAAILTWGILTLLWFIDYVATVIPDLFVVGVVRQISFSVHYLDLIRGVISTAALTYFLGLIILMVTLTVAVLRARRLL